jgi:hypothetical protein
MSLPFIKEMRTQTHSDTLCHLVDSLPFSGQETFCGTFEMTQSGLDEVSGPMLGSESLEIRVLQNPSRVMPLINSILGVSPTRSELVVMFEKMGWGRPTRGEKRVRASLVTRIESMAPTILPTLQTKQGIHALTVAYLQARGPPKPTVPQPSELPEVGIQFYLNRL